MIAGLIQRCAPGNVPTPAGTEEVIFQSTDDNLFYSKKSDGSFVLVGGIGTSDNWIDAQPGDRQLFIVGANATPEVTAEYNALIGNGGKNQFSYALAVGVHNLNGQGIPGEAQSYRIMLGAHCIGNTPTPMGTGASSLDIPENTAWAFTLKVIISSAVSAGGGLLPLHSYAADWIGIIINQAGVITMVTNVPGQSKETYSVYNSTMQNCAVAVTTDGTSLIVNATGLAGGSSYAVGTLDLTQIKLAL